MPTKLREFYWRELLAAKNAEKEAYDNALKKPTPAKKPMRR